MKKFFLLVVGVCLASVSFKAQMLAHDDIAFITQPVLLAQVGQLYEYDVDAIDPNGGIVTYELHSGPSGMTINSQTGMVLWTPTRTGTFRVRIRARSGHNSPSDGGSGEQEYTLRVLSGRPSVLRGFVRNTVGQGIANVRLRLFEFGSNHFLFNATSDSSGRYSFSAVNNGTHLLRAQPRDNNIYASQWFDRMRRIQDATLITIPESSIVTINVTLLPRDSANVSFNLSGNVSDTANAAIRQARVSFFRARQNSDLDNTGLNFEGLDNHHRDRELETSVLTDSNGNYRVRLQSRRYIILAEKQGYDQQFWDHKQTALDADIINLATDTSRIDFDLRQQQTLSASISGRITRAGDTTAVRAHVIGFHRQTPNGSFSGFTRQTQTDSRGSYTLPQLRSGFYVVLAVPQGEFLPTFYDTSGGTTNIARAFPVPVSNSAVNNIDIRVFPDTVTGLNRVRGVVTANGLPLAGAIVYAISAADNAVVGAAVSEKNGLYTIVGIAPSAYSLAAIKPGFTQTIVPSISIAQSGTTPTTVLQSLQLTSSPTSVAASSVPIQFELAQNYPNPFNPSTTISFVVGGQSFVTLKVFDIVGREIATLVNENLQAGTYQTSFNSIGLASGVYLYELKSGGFSSVRRMMLIK